jgi:hypothetical protein
MKCEMHCKDKKDDLVEYDAANKIWIHRWSMTLDSFEPLEEIWEEL